MAISDNIKKMNDKIREEAKAGKRTTGNKIRKKAMAAIMDGCNSESWKDYMRLFAKDEYELAKLMPEPNPNNKKDIERRNLSRVYLVGNGPCGADSPSGSPLDFGIGTTLD